MLLCNTYNYAAYEYIVEEKNVYKHKKMYVKRKNY